MIYYIMCTDPELHDSVDAINCIETLIANPNAKVSKTYDIDGDLVYVVHDGAVPTAQDLDEYYNK